MEAYLTIAGKSTAEYDEKRSRFLAAALPCDSEEAATAFLERFCSDYWDARHHVYAYVLKSGLSRFSDDGEPHGTAGKPVLDVISGSGLTDVLIIVTRYFGGVLLGTGGLVRAYSTAARDALAAAEVVEMCPCIGYSAVCPYSDYQLLLSVISGCGGMVTDTEFAGDITLNFRVKRQDTDKFEAALCERFSARLTAVRTGEMYSGIFREK